MYIYTYMYTPVSSTKTFGDLMSRCMMGGDAVCKNAKPCDEMTEFEKRHTFCQKRPIF